MIEPASAQLGRTKSKLKIGYRLLNMDRSLNRVFTTRGVVETDIAGNYVVSGGVDYPSTGGYIVWGLSGQDIAEAEFDPEEPDTTDALLAGIRMALDSLLARIAAIMPATPVIQMETAHFDTETRLLNDGLSAVRHDMETLIFRLAETVEMSSKQQAERVSEIQTQLTAIIETTERLQVLNDSVREVQALSAIRDRISEVIGSPSSASQIISSGNDTQLASTLETVRADVSRLSGITETIANRQPETVQLVSGNDAQFVTMLENLRADVDNIAETLNNNKRSDEGKAKALQAVNKLLAAVEKRQ